MMLPSKFFPWSVWIWRGVPNLEKKLIYGTLGSLFSRDVREGMYLNPLAEMVNHDEDVFITPC